MSKKDTDKINTQNTAEGVNELAGADESAKKKSPKCRLNSRKLKYGAMFYIIIALVIAIVVVVNIMVNAVAKRSPMKIDLTPDNRYELTDQSISVLKALKKDVDITVTATRDYFEAIGTQYENYYLQNYGVPSEIPYEMIPELLDKYSIYAEQSDGRINVKYVDMNIDPDVINKFKQNYNGEIGSGCIIISSGDRVRVISEGEVMNMLTADENAMRNQELRFNFTGESVLTSAIMNVTDLSPVRVAFIKTMNGAPIYDSKSGVTEDAVESFENELLEKNGYECTDVDIASEELDPMQYDMLVLFAPTVDLTGDLIQKMSDFLFNGGNYGKNMIYVPDYSQTELPNIAEFLADWSIKVENKYVHDADDKVKSFYDNQFYQHVGIDLDISDTDSVGTMPNEKLSIVAELPRELSEVKKNNGDIVKTVLTSSDTSYTVDMIERTQNTDDTGVKPIVMLSRKEDSEQLQVFGSELLVIGSPLMTGSVYLQNNTAFNNANVLINIINTMSGKENGIIIPDKNLQSSFLAPTAKQAKTISLIVIWIIPMIIASVGAIILIRRRNK
ncbi:Gldg family protein [Ruminococcus sp.]|uniref:Gldg family protein n=1 Tax=Ruminococcus sp. TaxID=41978 RepID=UPI001B4184CD|nr:Gldg family protein [Ruminococcus sp.]MBP5432313.1 GldG family protein [Ruminococcus sp.]